MLTEKPKRDWGRVPKAPDAQGRYRCSKCREWKDANAFNKNRHQKSGLSYACRDCMKTHVRSYNLPTKYGITPSEYAFKLVAQEGKCACCGTEFVMGGPKTLLPCVDHNHATGEVRDLLCGRCNLAAGNVLDSAEYAKKLVAYLEKWNC